MRSKTNSITLSISREEGIELRNQILEIVGDSLKLYVPGERDKPLHDLFVLLSNNFFNDHKDVNFILKGNDE